MVTTIAVQLWRLYTLRVCYLILFVGLGVFIWPSVIVHTPEFAARFAAQFSLLGGLGAISVLGLRYPLKMVPVLLFELLWKAVYLVFFALPLWRAHAITPAEASDIVGIVMVVVFLPLIPWTYVWREFVTARGERWR